MEIPCADSELFSVPVLRSQDISNFAELLCGNQQFIQIGMEGDGIVVVDAITESSTQPEYYHDNRAQGRQQQMCLVWSPPHWQSCFRRLDLIKSVYQQTLFKLLII